MNTRAKNYIDGSWAQAEGPDFESVDPSTECVNWTGAASRSSDISRAMQAAANSFRIWGKLPFPKRREFIEKFRDLLSRNRLQMGDAICADTGKPRWEADQEVSAMIGKVEHAVSAYLERTSETSFVVPPAQASIRFLPHGVVAVFGPFNLPGHLPNAHIIPALLAGNTVVFKPSEQSPITAELLTQMWIETGIPHGVINLVQGDRDTGRILSETPGLNGIFFTGSEAVGRTIHKLYGGRPEVILALEMGGNNPLVFSDTQNVTTAALITIESAFITSGQRCTCARRLIVVQGGQTQSFISELLRLIESIQVGPHWSDPEPFMGPLISGRSVEMLLQAEDSMIHLGGNSLKRLSRPESRGYFLKPGLIDVTNMSRRADTEFFGPLLQVIFVKSFDDAIEEANNTKYGLSGGLISDRPEFFEKFRTQVRAGIINWNRQTTGALSKLPFGGIGLSGNHRPSGYFAADYCSYPVASIEVPRPEYTNITGILS